MFRAVPCCSRCLFLCGPFCHGALKLDLSTLFAATDSLNISSIHIIDIVFRTVLACVDISRDHRRDSREG